MSEPTKLQLLAPARELETAIAAINAGADAVYIGGPHHGARASAGNSVDDIRQLCQYAHIFRCRVYVTLNTLVYEDELDSVRDVVRELYDAGVDALIVQDLALTAMDIPPIALHASTQCDARTPARARFLQNLGMSCIVVPREFSLAEIRAVSDAIDVPVEAFVHGALCVSYSGDCRASLLNGGRSANRGQCAQICRLPFNLTDGEGNVIVAGSHLLSLKDLNRLSRLADMADAGVSVFKIEGRLKDAAYVTTVVQAYSQALDDLCRDNPERYCRASFGTVVNAAPVDVSKVFNRGFTPYFIDGEKPMRLNSPLMPLTPKFVGQHIGKVLKSDGLRLTITSQVQLNNGDGLAYFAADRKFQGFRVNRVDGNKVYLASRLSIPVGTTLYRNYDKAYDDMLKSSHPVRRLALSATFSVHPGGLLSLTFEDERGCRVTHNVSASVRKAEKIQLETHRRIFAKLGDTCYSLEDFVDEAPDVFVPASILTTLRREVVSMLDSAARMTYRYEYRRPAVADNPWPEGSSVSFHQNVANSVAAGVYRKHGVEDIAMAMEVDLPSPDKEALVMTTRHCIRRHLGACLKTQQGKNLPASLYLTPADSAQPLRTMRLSFDCANCRMNLYAQPLSPTSSESKKKSSGL